MQVVVSAIHSFKFTVIVMVIDIYDAQVFVSVVNYL